jgi:hypothetical protein
MVDTCICGSYHAILIEDMSDPHLLHDS